MNIFIVYAHPSKKSYTYEILDKIISNLRSEDCNVELSDLYAMNFRSDMNEEEYKREGFVKTEISLTSDIIEEQRKIEWADCILFLYPVWWSDCPAKLKGWFDRVYSVGYAYGKNSDLPKMKTIKYGFVVCTAGHTNEFLHEIGIAQCMQTVMLNDRLGIRFENKEMLILGGTLDIENVRGKHNSEVENLTTKIKNYCNERNISR